MCVCVRVHVFVLCVCARVLVCLGAYGGQKRTQDPLEMDL